MKAFSLLLILVGAGALAWGQTAFPFAGQSVAAGSRLDVDLPVPAMNDGATVVPVSVFHGVKPGPVISIFCGIHGYEFPPILMAQRLLTKIDPRQLSGTVLLVRLAHVPAFQARRLFFNPNDGKNLNRVFPGSPIGSQSERIAHVLTSQILARSEFHFDLHGGDGSETLKSFAGTYGGKLAEAQAAKSESVGLAMGMPVVVGYKMDRQEDVDGGGGRSSNRQAVAMGIPTLLVEVGEMGRSDEAYVALLERGVLNALKSLKMLPGAPVQPAILSRRFEGTASVTATATGIWTPHVVAGTVVKQGDLIGTVRDYLGAELQRATATADGMVLYMNSAPPVNAGEGLATIALPRR